MRPVSTKSKRIAAYKAATGGDPSRVVGELDMALRELKQARSDEPKGPFGKLVFRAMAGRSFEQFSDDTGLKHQTVRRWIKGGAFRPTALNLNKLSQATGLPQAQILQIAKFGLLSAEQAERIVSQGLSNPGNTFKRPVSEFISDVDQMLEMLPKGSQVAEVYRYMRKVILALSKDLDEAEIHDAEISASKSSKEMAAS